jgi:ketosteroid isomerase-like protein
MPISTSAVPVVQEIYTAFSQRDVATLFRLFSHDIEIVQSIQLPWGGTYRGHEGALEFFGKLMNTINSTVVVERMIDAGERVVVIGWTRGKVNANGVGYDVPIAHVWTVIAGTVLRAEFYIDNPLMRTALEGAR